MGEVKPEVPTILIPLYVYPFPGAWQPLHTVIRQYPNLNFIIIINPASGPGASSSPDGNYTREIPQLNAHTNVQTVGYVATGYATRSLDDVFQDIKTYATWRDNKSVPGLGMDGIFLDETPNAYSSASFDFVSAIDKNVRSSEGWGTNGMIIHNPGTIPDVRYLCGPDITVIFEGAYETWRSNFSSGGLSRSPINRPGFMCNDGGNGSTNRLNVAFIVHSVPEQIARTGMLQLVSDLHRRSNFLFVTDLSEAYYAAFGTTWGQFVQEIDRAR